MLVWYYSTLSQIQTVYGSLTTAIATLLSVEIAAVVLLLGAQVLSEYERIGQERVDATPGAMHLDQARRRPRPARRVKPRGRCRRIDAPHANPASRIDYSTYCGACGIVALCALS